MTLPAFFLSDAHLGANPAGCVPDREAKLVTLLESWIGKASHVFILGDLFEFWMEYRHYVGKKHFRLLRALSLLVDQGCSVHLLAGNHDFAYDRYFPEELGVQVHQKLTLELQGRKIYLCHGDGLARSDWAYRAARKVIDLPLNRFLFRQLHPDWGMTLAKWVGGGSREANKDREHPLQEYLDAAGALMRTHHCDLFVHGHHHHGGQWTLPEGDVVNCGQWLFQMGFAKLDNGQCQYFDLNNS